MAKKPVIYILHGWAYSTEKWHPLVDSLKSEYIVNLLQIPGLTATIDQAWELNDYVEWLDSQIDSKPTILLGHSNGGRIATAYTLKYPDNVTKLILIDSAGIKDKRFKIRFKRFVFGNIAKVGKKLVPFSGLQWLLYKLSREKDYYQANTLMKQTMKNLISVDLEPEMHTIKVPTLLIWGANDTATPLHDGKKMHQLLPYSTLTVIDQARHSPQFTHTKEVLSEITSFIAEKGTN